MSFRRGICLLAAWCVLLHAAVIVRHNGMMVSASLSGPSTDFVSAMCHGGDAQPGAPSRAPTGGVDCPICTGLMPGVAIQAAPDAFCPPLPIASAKIETIALILVARGAVRPPTRGPPSIV